MSRNPQQTKLLSIVEPACNAAGFDLVELRLLLEQGGWVVTKQMGGGSVVLFADDPLFRLFWRSTQSLFVNAVLIGP